MVKKGTLYGVSVGPGDPELLTLKAVRVLEQCPVIAAPQTKGGRNLALDIAQNVVPLDDKIVLALHVAMHRDEARRANYEEAAAAVREQLDAGRDVAMPNLGDVSIYSTFSYLMRRLEAEGYETVMIPGVPSFCAVAARLQTSLTDRNDPLHIVPAGAGSLEEALDLPGTKVLMKSGKTMGQVLDTLAQRDLLDKSALVQDCGMPTEQAYVDLRKVPADTGYFSTIIVKE